MIDQAFISASSWSVRGISTPAEDKVTVKRAIASASRDVYKRQHHILSGLLDDEPYAPGN